MARERNAFKAGLFIICSIVAIIAIILGIKGAGRVIEPLTNRQVQFTLKDDLAGLRRGDDVRLGGYRVGIIKNIEVVDVKDAEPYILVTFSLPDRYHLHDDSEVVVQSSLTGNPSLNIERVGGGAELAVAKGQTSAFNSLLSTLGDAAPEIKAVVTAVRTETIPRANTLLTHVDSKIDPVTDHVVAVSTHADQTLVQARDLLGDTKPDIRGTLKNLNGVTGTLKDKLPALIDKVHETIENTKGTLLDVKQIAANGKDISVAARSVLVGNRGKIESIISGLKTTSDNLKGASAEVRRSPWRLLYKPEPSEMANLNIYDSARQFAEGASDLSDAASSLRDALNDPQTDKATLQKLVQKLDDSFTGFHAVENKLWTTVK